MLNETFYVIFKHCVKSLKATIGYDNIRMMSRPLKLLLRSAKKLFLRSRRRAYVTILPSFTLTTQHRSSDISRISFSLHREGVETKQFTVHSRKK